MKWKLAGSSVQGLSHIKKGIPCQDYISLLFSHECYCIGLADGAGSAKFADLGASLTSNKVCELIAERFEILYDAPANEVKGKIIHIIRTTLGKYAKNKQIIISEFASTLLFVAVKGNKFIAGHIGDGIVGTLKDNVLVTLSPPENGEYANETYFTTSKNYQKHLRLFKGETTNIDGFVLMSDGTSESLFDKQNRILAPIVKDIIEWLDDNAEEVVNEALTTNLINVIRPKTTDDCSIAIMKKIEKTPPSV